MKAGLPSEQSELGSVFPTSALEISTTVPGSVTKQEYWARICFDLLGKPKNYLVWLIDWNVFSTDGDLLTLIEGYRRAQGETRTLAEAPGHLFEISDSASARGLFRFAMAFEWGAYLVGLGGRPVVITINDCFLKIRCMDETSLNEVKAFLLETGVISDGDAGSPG